MASVRRAREREKRQAGGADSGAPLKVLRDVIVPDTITVQELANRMAERATDVIKTLMNMGVMATINQSIDADTAQLVADEFGHRVKRVSAADVEIGFIDEGDEEAGQVARALAKLHNETFENADLTRRFDQPQRFLDCRVNPYFESIARHYPSLACAIRSEINRLLSVRKVLVHGDYSPKNILISPDGAQVWLLDAEAAHVGDPSFDIAFLLSHLLLKAVKVHSATERMLEAFLHIGSTYGQAVDIFSTSWIEKHTCREMGLLLLARVDGKSPVEYLATDSEKNIVRCAAIRVIQERPERYTTVAGIIAEEIQRARHAV